MLHDDIHQVPTVYTGQGWGQKEMLAPNESRSPGWTRLESQHPLQRLGASPGISPHSLYRASLPALETPLYCITALS